MALGKTVKTLREARGWTLKDLSKRSGVPVGTIGALEVRDSVRSEYAAKLAKGFEIPLEELLPATATATLTAPSPTLVATGLASNHALAPVQKAQTATNNVASIDQGLDVLLAYLAQADAGMRKAAAGLLAGLAESPDSPNLRAALTALLTPSGFADQQRRAA